MSRRRGWSLETKTASADRVLAGEDLDTVSRDIGVKADTLTRWVSDRRARRARLAQANAEHEAVRMDAELLSMLMQKGERLLALDRVRFYNLLEIADAALACVAAQRQIEGAIGKHDASPEGFN